MKTHVTWSIETPDGKCPKCATATILVSTPEEWKVPHEDEHGEEIENDPYLTVHDEVTGHVCPKCSRLCSLSINTIQ